MTPFDFGVIILTRYPYTDLLRDKRRPAVIVSSSAYAENRPDVVAMAVSSQLKASAAFAETWIEAWSEAGLLKPSAVKPLLFTLEPPADVRVLGMLAESDRSALRRSLQLILG